MFYAMRITEGVPTRYGRMYRSVEAAIKQARKVHGYVERYGKGVIWTARAGFGI